MSQNNILFDLVKRSYYILDKLNFVEVLKKMLPFDRRVTIDLYISLKWLTVTLAIVLEALHFTTNHLVTFIITYLLLFTTITYFKYHIVFLGKSSEFQVNPIKRFVYLVQAFFFITFCYSFFYFKFHEYIEINTDYSTYLSCLFYSISNALISTNFTSVESNTLFGDFLVISQILHSFTYIVFLFSITKFEK